jgi:hypothetical protein
MGNTYGFFTIDTKAINTERENFMVKNARRFEKHILPLLTPSDPPKHILYKKEDHSLFIKNLP